VVVGVEIGVVLFGVDGPVVAGVVEVVVDNGVSVVVGVVEVRVGLGVVVVEVVGVGVGVGGGVVEAGVVGVELGAGFGLTVVGAGWVGVDPPRFKVASENECQLNYQHALTSSTGYYTCCGRSEEYLYGS